MNAFEVIRAGALTTVQDLGRRGYAHLGVPAAGAVDAPALALANRLVGNPPDAAGLEFTMTGGVLRATGAGTVAVTGADVRRLRVGGAAVGFGRAVPVAAGEIVDIGGTRTGVRTYLAVAGGIAVPPVLGSRSTDTLSGLGPPVLCDGETLPVGTASGAARSGPAPAGPVSAGPVSAGSVSAVSVPAEGAPLRVWPGPRADWFTPAALAVLGSAEYVVSALSNRIAARLTGPPLERAVPGELPSEGLVLGAVQVPPSGEPLVFLADHPTTGGYPVIGVVDPADLPRVAQCRPGRTIRFVLLD